MDLSSTCVSSLSVLHQGGFEFTVEENFSRFSIFISIHESPIHPHKNQTKLYSELCHKNQAIIWVISFFPFQFKHFTYFPLFNWDKISHIKCASLSGDEDRNFWIWKARYQSSMAGWGAYQSKNNKHRYWLSGISYNHLGNMWQFQFLMILTFFF